MFTELENVMLVGFENAPFLISLFAGILTFLSPCILPLLPIYLSYISGISIHEMKQEGSLNLYSRLRVILQSLFFILGFSTVFLILGATMARILSIFLQQPIFAYFAGGILILFGLHMMHIIQIPFLYYEKKFFLNLQNSKGKILQSFSFFFTPFLLGVSFGLGWSPCVGPILSGIITFVAADERQFILLVCYALGLGFSFLISAIMISSIAGLIQKFQRYFNIVEILAGLLLIIMGILVATGYMNNLSAFLVESTLK
ncbi:hypothetical protein CCZ01_00190 [Helicobacter monodelphidis]|uniref:cytochrome c biogenesis CcdA family protein n=1 Tax=Helicobacter sp. 15-1451 TaxID=2004995 RepID=UPI000DCB35AC|nr:cytochrome c biogenesis protein CcdA [Helicobacter sp. 15-1451]RAX59202.1 hypothetical protein CCZ01_00190 [Helicobacter sp. 15-1451]